MKTPDAATRMRAFKRAIRKTRASSAGAVTLMGWALLFAAFQSGCATRGTTVLPAVPAASAQVSALREQWGIEVTSLRLSANGRLIDFRYRVLDPAKAAALGDPKNTPVLIDQETDTRMRVPTTPKIGPLRQTAEQLEAGKIYFALFANSGLLVKSGSLVTVEIGGFRAADLAVQ